MDVAATSKLPSPLCLSGNVHENWTKFKDEFDDYLVSIEFHNKSDEVKTAKLRNLIGDEGRHVVADLNLRKSSDYCDMIAKLDNWAESHKNLSRLRSQFFDRKQGENESFENFLNDVKTLVKRCNFGDLTEDLLRDKIVTGIFDPQLKELFNTTYEVPLESAIQLCRVINLSEDQLLKLLTLKRGGKISYKDFVSEGVGKSYIVDQEDEESDDEDTVETDSAATGSHILKSAGKKHEPVLVIESRKNAQLTNKDSVNPLKTLKTSSDDDSDAVENIENEKIEATLRFTVENISEMKTGERRRSFPLKLYNNFSWRIMVTCRAKIEEDTKWFGFFVECEDESEENITSESSLSKLLEPWSCNAACKMTVLNQIPETEPLSRETVHAYTKKDSDWGYPHMMNWDALLNPDNGYILNDSVILEAKITILETP